MTSPRDFVGPVSPSYKRPDFIGPVAPPFVGPVSPSYVAPRGPQVYVQPATRGGKAIYDALDMPDEWADDPFTMNVDERGNLVRMTVAAGLEWLAKLSARDKEAYNAWVVKLYDAGYLTEADVRFGRYTSTVGQAFVEAAYDTASTNLTAEEGGVVTLGDLLDDLAEGAEALRDPESGPEAPVRVDQQLDEGSLRESLRETSRSLLGRALSDDEEARLVSRFRSAESAWNNNRWNVSQTGGTVTSAPDVGALARDDITDGPLATERAAQQLGGYAQVLKNMVGLGGSSAIGGTLNASG